MQKIPRAIIIVGIVGSLGAGAYWLLTSESNLPLKRSAGEARLPAGEAQPGENAMGNTSPNPRPGTLSMPSAPQEEPGPADANPDVKMVDGVKMLRGHTVDGQEVWIPAAPEPEAAPAEPAEEPEFLPAPGQ